jgi:hypothetical protein
MNNNELSYYRLSLLSFLKESHPELAKDSSFINSRGDLAANAYSDAVKNGSSHEQAAEIANNILFNGLHFSIYDMIINVLWNEFSQEVPQASAKDLAMKLLSVCEPMLARYSLSDDFAYTPEYDLLYTELTGTIIIWLEEHEL